MTSRALRHGASDGLLVGLAIVHGAVLLAVPPAPVIALAFWWNANTIAHNFIHQPFFRSRQTNALFSMYLSALLGLPQTLWRDRHLAHHAERRWRMRPSPQLGAESLVVLTLWTLLATRLPEFMLWHWIPGLLGGLMLSHLQGHYEHVRGTVSHYGRVYNTLFFNDGYHVEHHAHPATHWTQLPRRLDSCAPRSRWPAVLRWLDRSPLDDLERLVLRSPALQRFVVDRHERAFRRLAANLVDTRRVTIIGGGLFPRTAIVVHRVFPNAEITVVDRSAANLESARAFLDAAVTMVAAEYEGSHAAACDLLIVPLAFRGDRSRVYGETRCSAVMVHDWLWHRRGGASAVVSVFLLKRLNLVA